MPGEASDRLRESFGPRAYEFAVNACFNQMNGRISRDKLGSAGLNATSGISCG